MRRILLRLVFQGLGCGTLGRQGKPSQGGCASGALTAPPGWSVSLWLGPEGHGLRPALSVTRPLRVPTAVGSARRQQPTLASCPVGPTGALSRPVYEALPWDVGPP